MLLAAAFSCSAPGGYNYFTYMKFTKLNEICAYNDDTISKNDIKYYIKWCIAFQHWKCIKRNESWGDSKQFKSRAQNVQSIKIFSVGI